MKTRFSVVYRNVMLLTIVACAGCTDTDSASRAAMPSRPVTVIELAARDYSRENTRTGSVGLYREERIGFEVSGRVLAVLDEGLEVRGPAFDENGELVRSGDVIATLEKTRYRLQVEAVEARLDAARRDIEAVQAQLKLAGQTLDRQRRLLDKDVGNEQAVDDAQSAHDRAIAELEARRAAVNEVEEELARAREDLADTRLLAPFSGRITSVHVTQGAVVEPGTPVVRLTLMDPVQVQVAVSADDERAIQTGDRAIIYPKDPLHGGQRIPVNAITMVSGKHAVFSVDQGRARARPVRVAETFRELRRIEGPGISDGTRVIVGGVHYVSDGQPVTITETLP